MTTFADQQSQIEALYVGYFGRAGDPAGMQYWLSRLDGTYVDPTTQQLLPAMSLAQIAASFSVQTESTNLYPFLAHPLVDDAAHDNAAAFINSVFEDLFNRAENSTVDPAGFAYWLARVVGAAGNPQAIGQIVEDIISGATGADNLTVTAKVAVGDYFTNAFAASHLVFSTAATAEAQLLVSGTNSANVAAQEAAAAAWIASPPPAYVLTSSHDATHQMNEGQGIDYTIFGGSSAANQNLSYTITPAVAGNGFSGADISGAPLVGTITLDATGTGVLHLAAIADNITEGPEAFTLTVTTPAGTLTDTITILDTSTTQPLNLALTTGTDNITVANSLPTENGFAPPNGNVINATDTTGFVPTATLGQNDVINLNGTTGNTLNLATQGIFPAFETSFTVSGIQTFNVNSNAFGGTIIDMSSWLTGAAADNLATFVDNNSSSNITLNNVTGLINSIQILNTSDIGGASVNLTVNYQAPLVSGTADLQAILLNGVMSPVNGLPNTALTIPGIETIALTSNGAAPNGLTTIADAALTSVVVGGAASLVMDNLAFALNGTLDLSGTSGTFFDIGKAAVIGNYTAVAPSINAGGTLTILGGAGGMNASFTPNVSVPPTVTGGTITAVGLATFNIGTGSFKGQQVTAGSVTITGGGAGSGGFINNPAQITTITTTGGNVNINGIAGGLGGAGATITTAGGNVNIGTSPVGSVTGGITEKIDTRTGGVGGNVNVNLSAGANSLAFLTNTGAATIGITGGTNLLDFSQGSSGFHGGGVLITTDSVNANPAASTNTLLLTAGAAGSGGPLGGLATGVQNITFQNGDMATVTTGGIDMALLDQTGIVQNITVNAASTAANVTLFDLTSTDNLVFNTWSFNPQTLNTGFTAGAGVLNLTVPGGSDVVLQDTANGGHTLGTLNFTANGGSSTLEFSSLNAITSLSLSGTSNVTVLAPAGGAATLTTITGANANYNLNALAATYLSTSNALSANIGFTNWAAAFHPVANFVLPADTITLGSGTDAVTVNGGSWTIELASSGGNVDTVTLNPGFGNSDFASTGAGNDVFNVGNLGGIVHLAGGAGNDTFNFNMSGVSPGLNSAQYVDGGSGINGIVLNSGALNENDSLFSDVINVQDFTVAAGFNNGLLMNAAANVSGLTDIFTSGGGSSNVFRESTGFTNAMTYHIAVGDTGGDAIIVSPVSGAITVDATETAFNTAFGSALNTVAIDPGTGFTAASGIVGSAAQANLLNLTADGSTAFILGAGGFGLTNIQTIHGVDSGAGANEAIFVISNPATQSHVATIDLSAVQETPFPSNSGNTLVWDQVATVSQTIIGGSGNFSTLVGGSGNDTITARAFGANWIWGNGGGDNLTGAAGSPGPQTGGATTFVFNSVANLLAENGATVGGVTATITNFHAATDAFFINPADVIATNAAIVTPHTSTDGTIIYEGFAGGTSLADSLANLSTLLHGGGTGAGGAIEEAYDTFNNMMYLDIDNNGTFNATDISFSMTFGSNPPGPGGVTNQTAADFNGNTANSGLGFNGANVYTTVPTWLAFNLTIPTWNSGAPLPTMTTAVFSGAGGSLTTNLSITSNYDFSALTSGVTVTTQNYTGGPYFGAGTITGTNFADSFFVSTDDLFGAPANGLVINDGSSGANQITLDQQGSVSTINLGGVGSGEVFNVQTLNLGAGAAPWVVSFTAGQQFQNITKLAGSPQVTINTANLNAGGVIDLAAGTTVDTVNLAYDLAGTVIALDGLSTVNVDFIPGFGGLTTEILGFNNTDTVKLNAGPGTYWIDHAVIQNVWKLWAPDADHIALNPDQIGGTTGFTNLNLVATSDLGFNEAGTANFTNVAFSGAAASTIELQDLANGVTVKILSTEIFTNIQNIASSGETLWIADNGIYSLTAAAGTFTNLGTVDWGTGTLTIDSATSHGITGLEGGVNGGVGYGTLETVFVGAVNTAIDLIGLTTWSGIGTIDVRDSVTTLVYLTSSEAVSVSTTGFATIQADNTLGGSTGQNQGLDIFATGSYDLTNGGNGGLTVTGVNGGYFTALYLDGYSWNNITVTVSDQVFESTIFVVDGGGGNTDSLVVNPNPFVSTVDLSHITSFTGWQNVSINLPDDIWLVKVDDTVSSSVIANGGTATINDNGYLAVTDNLITSALSHAAYGGTGNDTAWTINGFNAGTANATLLQVNAISGSDIVITAGATLNAAHITVISGALGPTTSLTDLTNGGAVETALITYAGVNAGAGAAADYYVALYGNGPAANTVGIYDVHTSDNSGAAITAADTSVNLIGILTNVAAQSLVHQNFA